MAAKGLLCLTVPGAQQPSRLVPPVGRSRCFLVSFEHIFFLNMRVVFGLCGREKSCNFSLEDSLFIRTSTEYIYPAPQTSFSAVQLETRSAQDAAGHHDQARQLPIATRRRRSSIDSFRTEMSLPTRRSQQRQQEQQSYSRQVVRNELWDQYEQSKRGRPRARVAQERREKASGWIVGRL